MRAPVALRSNNNRLIIKHIQSPLSLFYSSKNIRRSILVNDVPLEFPAPK